MHEILTVVHGTDILNVLIEYICTYVTYLLKIISISTASGLFIYLAIRSKASQIEDTSLIRFLSTSVDYRSEPSFLVCLGFPTRRGVLVC